MTILDYKNWITKNSTDTVMISGAKHASNNIILTNASYENLPIPKYAHLFSLKEIYMHTEKYIVQILYKYMCFRLTVPVCVAEIVTQDITNSLIIVDDLVVNNLHVSNVIGARDLNSTMFDSVSALHSVDFTTKLFTGQVFVKNISALEIKGIDVRGKM